MVPNGKEQLVRRFFSGITEQTFQTQLGVADPPLVEYLVDLLERFIRSDAIFGIRDLEGRRLREVSEMLSEAQHRLGSACREIYRHVGDFTLFWAGIYPEALGRLQGKGSKDHFIDYCNQGKRSYRIASTFPVNENPAQSAVLERLSRDFELCVYGLREVRREWERNDSGEVSTGPWLIN